jgi:hypothetical protein
MAFLAKIRVVPFPPQKSTFDTTTSDPILGNRGYQTRTN